MNIFNSDYNDRMMRIAGVCIALFVGLAFIDFVIEVQWDMKRIQGISPKLFPLMGKYALAGLLWGVVLEIKNLLRVLKNGPALNWLIIPTIALLIQAFWPWAAGFFYPSAHPYDNILFYINPRSYPGAHMMISTAAGVLLVRSFLKTDVGCE